VIPSIKSKEILIDIFLKIFFITIGMHTSKPVFKVNGDIVEIMAIVGRQDLNEKL